MMTESNRRPLQPEIMALFPSGTAAPTFAEWVANHAGLEQVLGVAGMLSPSFYEVNGVVVWDKHVAEQLQDAELTTPFGGDATTTERYFNVLNLAEFFLMSADEAVERTELVRAFGSVVEHFWQLALVDRFPDRRFLFEIKEDLFNEEGLCLTFWQQRDAEEPDHRSG